MELQDIRGTAVKNLINFIFTGSIDIDNENVLDLLSTADYLQMDEAKKFCFEFLQSVINSDTCFFVLSAAILHQNEQLKQTALDCINKEIGEVEFDKNLSKNDMITCITKMKTARSRESAIYNVILSWTKFDKTREKEFLELLFLVDFTKLNLNFIQTTILTEELVTENLACLKFVTAKLCHASKINRVKQSGETKVISVGGSKTPQQVADVYSCFDEPLMKYPDISVENNSICSGLLFAGKLEGYIYIGEVIKKSASSFPYSYYFTKLWKLHTTETAEAAWESVAACNPAHFTLMVSEGVWTESCTSESCIKFYLPHKNHLSEGPEFNEKRTKCAVASCKGQLFVLGGWHQLPLGRCLSSVELLTVEELLLKDGKWKFVEPMQKPRMNFAAVNCEGKIFAIGGQSSTKQSMKSVEKFDAENMEWSYVSSMNFKRQKHAACVVDRKIIVVGGVDDQDHAIHEIECYDPAEDVWNIVGETEKELYDHILIAV